MKGYPSGTQYQEKCKCPCVRESAALACKALVARAAAALPGGWTGAMLRSGQHVERSQIEGTRGRPPPTGCHLDGAVENANIPISPPEKGDSHAQTCFPVYTGPRAAYRWPRQRAVESYPMMERVADIESYPEISRKTSSLSGSGQTEEPATERATGADGTARGASTAERPTDADGVHQSRGGAHRQQTVRVRHDSLITTCPEASARLQDTQTNQRTGRGTAAPKPLVLRQRLPNISRRTALTAAPHEEHVQMKARQLLWLMVTAACW